MLARFEKKNRKSKGGKALKKGLVVSSNLVDQPSNDNARQESIYSYSVLSPDSMSLGTYSKQVSEYGGGMSLHSGYTSPKSS